MRDRKAVSVFEALAALSWGAGGRRNAARKLKYAILACFSILKYAKIAYFACAFPKPMI